jgi:hypothetical protein
LAHAGTLIEIEKVCAAPQQHMLAIVHDLAGAGVLVGRGPPAQIRTPLE